MERKNGGTRWSEISAHDFFFLFFHRRANESVSFQRATKESEIFRGEHANYLRGGLREIASSIMKQEREESSCAPHEDEPRWIFAHQLTISSLAWWLSLSNVLNIILRSQAHDHPGPLILSNTSSSIMGLYLLTNLFNEWVSCKYFSFFFRRFTVDDHSNDAREIATFFFNNF